MMIHAQTTHELGGSGHWIEFPSSTGPDEDVSTHPAPTGYPPMQRCPRRHSSGHSTTKQSVQGDVKGRRTGDAEATGRWSERYAG
jgi:hypothetical protein